MSSLTLSPKAFNEAIETTERLKTKLAKIQQAGEAKAGLVVTGATVVAVEGLAGYLRGRFGEKKVGPINAEIAAGVAAEVLALTGLFGRYSESVAMAGHATIGFAIGIEAMKIGEKHAEEAESIPRRRTRETIEAAGEEVDERPARREASIQKRSTERLPPQRKRVDLRRSPSTMADDVVEAEPAVKTGT